MFETQPYIVYIRHDAQCRITAVDSSAFLRDTDGWREIDSGFDVKHHHAQGNYFEKPLYDYRSIHRYITEPVTVHPDRETSSVYKYKGETWGVYERTQEEMDADWLKPVLDTFELDLMADHEYRLCCLELGI